MVSDGAGPGPSPAARRIVKVVLIVALAGMAAFVFLVDQMQKRAIDYRSAEQVYAKLDAGGFECEEIFFPKGSNEDPPYSVGSCRVGFSAVHISVNQERGRWLFGFTNAEPYESGEAAVHGRNWTVSFEATNSNSIKLAKQVQRILGGDIVHPLPQDDS